jgi:hypothetical protein
VPSLTITLLPVGDLLQRQPGQFRAMMKREYALTLTITRRPTMRAWTLVLLLAASAAAQDNSGDTAIWEQPVASYTSDANRMDAVLQLTMQKNLPLGIEYVGAKMFEPVAVHAETTNLRALLNMIFPGGAGFQLSVQDGVLNVSHIDVPRGHSNMLDTVLASFSMGRWPIWLAVEKLQSMIGQQLRPRSPYGFGASVAGPRYPEREVGPFSLRQVTIRQALNRIVQDRRAAVWIAQALPENLASSGDRPCASFEYDDWRFDDLSQITGRSTFLRRFAGR